MISFRYHLVSIIAVFLALALGIVVGTTGLNGEILKGLKQEVKSLRADNGALRASNSDLNKQAQDADSFVADYQKKVVAGTLTNKTVLVISAPGVPETMKAGVEAAVKAASGSVVSRIQLAPAYLDPARQQDIRNFATTSASRPTGLQLPTTSDATVLGGALLSYVLSGKGTSNDLAGVIAGLSTLQILRVEGGDPKPAQYAVVLTSGTVAKNDPKAKAMPALVTQLNQIGMRTVVAGDAAATTEQGLLAVVRADATLTRSVSTVDDADTALGRISVALALARSIPGQYGNGAGVDRLFPTAK